MSKLWDEGGKEPFGAGYGPKPRLQAGIDEAMRGAIMDARRTNRADAEGPPPDPSPPLSDEVMLRRLVDDQFSDGVAKQIRAGIAHLPEAKRAELLRAARKGADIQDLLIVAQGGFSKAQMAEKARGRNWP